jgi:hypothetical protein
MFNKYVVMMYVEHVGNLQTEEEDAQCGIPCRKKNKVKTLF